MCYVDISEVRIILGLTSCYHGNIITKKLLILSKTPRRRSNQTIQPDDHFSDFIGSVTIVTRGRNHDYAVMNLLNMCQYNTLLLWPKMITCKKLSTIKTSFYQNSSLIKPVSHTHILTITDLASWLRKNS